MEWLENRVARAARWLTGWNPAELAVWIFMLLASSALLVPWLQHTRDSARRVQTRDNLRRVGTAMFVYNDTYRSLPLGGTLPEPATPASDSGQEETSANGERP